jgi:hypothetical protein
MNDLDRKIQAALKRDAPNDPLSAEPNFAEELFAAFRGRNRWLSFLAIKMQFVFVLGLGFAGYKFYHATEVVSQLRWGGLGLALLLMVAMIKLWFWMEMHSNRVLREVKRVELLLISRPPA